MFYVYLIRFNGDILSRVTDSVMTIPMCNAVVFISLPLKNKHNVRNLLRIMEEFALVF